MTFNDFCALQELRVRQGLARHREPADLPLRAHDTRVGLAGDTGSPRRVTAPAALSLATAHASRVVGHSPASSHIRDRRLPAPAPTPIRQTPQAVRSWTVRALLYQLRQCDAQMAIAQTKSRKQSVRNKRNRLLAKLNTKLPGWPQEAA